MRPDLPSGTVTFCFTDVEGSTRLLHELGAERYAEALAEHRRVIREACAAEGGVEVDTQGDAFFFAFPTAPGALAAAAAFTEALASGPISVRVGIHTGTPHRISEGYVGADVHLAARIAACGHGGQVVASHATAALLETPLLSLGSHRLKDVPEPITLYQLEAGSFPPLKTIANSNLPTPASSFLGREDELYEADLLLQGTRLLTIHGPGGQGKTRFSLELARRAREERFSHYPDGVFSCFFSSLRDPSLVLATIAQTLSVKEQPGQSALDTLSSHLEGKRVLLLLDNLEHLLEAAPELSQLLERAAGLTLLVTSREVLRIAGETSYALPPLPEEESLLLLCERARVEPSEPLRELAKRLEGLPLALELAAARLSILTPRQLLERLSQRLDLLKAGRDADPRQQTLRATIEWSYDLLSDEEQRLFRALSVFAGGCTLEAAEEVAGADLDTLQSLVDKSLLRFTPSETGGRYWMLETLREFATDQLRTAMQPGDVTSRFDEFFVHFAICANAEPARVERDCIDRLERERANLRAALASSLTRNAVEAAFELAIALARLAMLRGPQGEGRHWLAEVLRRQGGVSVELRRRALSAAANLAERQNDIDSARTLAKESLALARVTGDADAVGGALLTLGIIEGDAGDLERSEALQHQALQAFFETGNDRQVRQTLGMLAFVYIARGDYPRAADVSRQALELSRASGDERGAVAAASNLGHAMMSMGDFDEARALQREAVLGAHHIGDVQGMCEILLDVAALAMAAGRHDDGATLLGVIEGLSESAEFSLVSVEVDWFEELREQACRVLGEGDSSRRMDLGRRMSIDEALAVALASLD